MGNPTPLPVKMGKNSEYYLRFCFLESFAGLETVDVDRHVEASGHNLQSINQLINRNQSIN